MLKSLLLVGSVILSATLMSVKFDSNSGEEVGLEIGKRAPLTTLEMKAVDGSLISIESQVKERGIVIVFSCNTCPFVVGNDDFEGWEVQYNELKERAEGLGFGFVLVNSNEGKRTTEDSYEEMKKRSSDKQYKMPYLVDEKSVLADAFGAKTTPHVFVLNNNQELIYKGAIDNKVDSKRKSDELYLLDALSATANETDIVLNTTPPRGCSIKRVASK